MFARIHAACLLTLMTIALHGIPSAARAGLLAYSLIDRKFPVGTFCPIETRNGKLITFQAPANGSVLITFAAANQYPNDEDLPAFNDPAIDNVYVMPLVYWQGNAFECSSTCFSSDFSSHDGPGAPNFPGSEEILSELPYAEQFHSDPHVSVTDPWQGGTWTDSFTAPWGPISARYCEPGFTGGGALRLGSPALGDVTVSASLTVDGLLYGTTYVVFCWFRVNSTRESGPISPARLEVSVNETDLLGVREGSFSLIKVLFR